MKQTWRMLTAVMTLAATSSVFPLHAQHVAASFRDSLQSLRQKYLQVSDTLPTRNDVNPLYYRMVGPITFFSSALNRTFSLDSMAAVDRDDRLNEAIDRQLLDTYLHQPYAVHHYDAQYHNEQIDLSRDEREDISRDLRNVLKTDIKDANIDDFHEDIDDIGLKVVRPNFWTTTGSFSLQFTQNYFSDNWYKGGSNTENLLASLTLQANYNDQRWVTWENRLLMRLGFITSPGDSCHSFLTNNDKLNLYSKLGIKAAKSWYYTITTEANTQFMPGYRSNNRLTYSDFMSPLDFYVSVGMDYKPTLKNGNTFSVALLPLSYKFRYIMDDDANIHAVYSMADRDFEQDWGSKMEVNAKFTVVKNLTWKCRAYYFTSYEYVEAELENTLSFSFNKYLSTELYTLWRYDDNRPRKYYDDNLGYFQFKEYFTFGLKYDF